MRSISLDVHRHTQLDFHGVPTLGRVADILRMRETLSEAEEAEANAAIVRATEELKARQIARGKRYVAPEEFDDD